jgi:glycosyltransferase involved in cell wall biosynthesis
MRGYGKNMNPLLSVVVPAYNEADKIRQGILDDLVASLQQRASDWEVVIADDGSTDDTPDLVAGLSSRNSRVNLLQKPHCGKGFAVLAGMQAARGEHILFTDFDQATPIGEVEHLLPWFERGYDIVIGTRGTGRPQAPLMRKCLSRGYILVRGMLLGSDPIIDTQCGFKAFTRKSLQTIIEHLHLYHPTNSSPVHGRRVTPGFDVELLLVARQLGYKIKSVPVAWSHRQCRGMNLSYAVIQGLVDLIRIRLLRSRGKYVFNNEAH